MLHLQSIIKDITNSIFNACIIITRETIYIIENINYNIYYNVSESRRRFYSKYTDNEFILYFVLCFVLSALAGFDSWPGYIYVVALLTTFVFKDLLASLSLLFVLMISCLIHTTNDDYMYGSSILVDNFSGLLCDPLFFILFIYLFKTKTFKNALEELKMSYTDFLKVSLVLFMAYYSFSFFCLWDRQVTESSYYSLFSVTPSIGDQQYMINYDNPFFHLPISLSFYVDELSILFMGLSLLLICLCILFLWPTLELDVNRSLYISQLFLLLTQLQATFTSANLLTFFVAFESLLIPMMIMIAIWGSKNNRQANNYLVFYTMFSAIPMLLAILYINYKAGTLNISELHELMLNHSITWTWEEEMYLWLAFFLGFAVKTPMVPFHIWLPKAHVDAPTVGSVILAGLLLKVGLVGFIRVLLPLFPQATIFFSPYVSAVATVGVIYSSLITLRQIDMKRIIAYSSVAHMNMALVALCSLNGIGIYSSIYLMLSHGLIASGLFFLVGFLYNRFHVRSIENYSGLGTIMPIMCMFFFIFTLANIAFPLTSGFIGEFLLLLGISLTNFYLGFLNAFSMLLTTVYSMLLFGRVFLGELNPWFQNRVEAKYMMEKVTAEVQKDNKQQFSYEYSVYFNEYEYNIFKPISFFDIYYYEMIILIFLLIGIFSMGIYPHFIFKFLVDSPYLSYIINYTLDCVKFHNFLVMMLNNYLVLQINSTFLYGFTPVGKPQPKADFADSWELSFQDPAAPIMEGIINLHHDIMFILVFVAVFVITVMYFIIVHFEHTEYTPKFSYEPLMHNTKLEFIWTLVSIFNRILQFLYLILVGPIWGFFIKYYIDKILYKLSVYRLRFNPLVPVVGMDYVVFRQSEVQSAPLIGLKKEELYLSEQLSESAPLSGDLNDKRFLLWRDYRYTVMCSTGTSNHENRSNFLMKSPPSRGNGSPGSIMSHESNDRYITYDELVWLEDNVGGCMSPLNRNLKLGNRVSLLSNVSFTKNPTGAIGREEVTPLITNTNQQTALHVNSTPVINSVNPIIQSGTLPDLTFETPGVPIETSAADFFFYVMILAINFSIKYIYVILY